MAWVMARMCDSVNVPRSGVPRCPLVPKATRSPGSLMSGSRSKYARSSRAASISNSGGAGLPARGEIAIGSSSFPIKVALGHWARFRVPDAGCILGDRAVAGEFSGAGYVQDGFARPGVLVGVQLDEPLVGLQIRLQVRQVHVKIPMRQQAVAQRLKDAR